MFWTQFEALCARCGKSPNAVAAELEIPSGSITAWRKGTQPRNSTVKKIADYFDVTVQYLLFGETSDPGIKKEPTGQSADGQELEFIELMRKLTDTEKDVILAQLRGLAQGR